MANITTHTQPAAPLFGFVRSVFSSLGDGFRAMFWAARAARQVEALMALSDEELENRGLKRGEIAKYVFSDNLWT